MGPQTVFSIFTVVIICMTIISINYALFIAYKKETITIKKAISISILTCFIGYIVLFIFMIGISYLFERLL